MVNLRKKIYTAYAVWLCLGFTFGILAGTVSHFFVAPMILLQLAIGVYVGTRKCPSCHKAVLYNQASFLGAKMHVWTVGVPDVCSQCGHCLAPREVQ